MLSESSAKAGSREVRGLSVGRVDGVAGPERRDVREVERRRGVEGREGRLVVVDGFVDISGVDEGGGVWRVER
jgi:hypothetical protein